VRGEVAEDLLARLFPDNGPSPTDAQAAKAHAALVKSLSDPDGYVVAKAAFTLTKSDFAGSAADLMDAAQKRPELAVDVLKSLSDQPAIAPTLVRQILVMTRSSSPAVRAAALATLAQSAALSNDTVVRQLLSDPDPNVSSAAVAALVPLIEQLRPKDWQVPGLSFFGLYQPMVPVDANHWVADFRQGKNRPAWLNDAIPALEKELQHGDAQAAAAVVMCAMGREKQAWPILMAPNVEADKAAPALKWLPWDQRAELFNKLAASDPANLAEIVNCFVSIPDARAGDVLSKMIDTDDAAAVGRMAIVHNGLAAIYFGDQFDNVDSLPEDRKKIAIDAATKMATAGTGLQPTVGLSLLLMASPSDAAKAAQQIYGDPKKPQWARLDALQVLLTALPDDQATQTAVAALHDKPMRQAAAPFLAVGPAAIARVHKEIDLDSAVQSDSYPQSQPIEVTPPPGLDIATAADVMADQSPDVAAYGGYLLAVLGDRTGLPPLLRMARAQDWQDPWGKLAYRAIAKINDDSLMPTLEEIYRRYMQLNQDSIREMYWTIGKMTGPNVAHLRKTMESEFGNAKLQ
jgi:HEAT repeat protein